MFIQSSVFLAVEQIRRISLAGFSNLQCVVYIMPVTFCLNSLHNCTVFAHLSTCTVFAQIAA